MNEAIISMGSNIEPRQNIDNAITLMAEDIDILNTSEFILTKPVGFTEQADFLNGAVRIKTDLSLEELRAFLKNIEKQLGRNESNMKNGPRTIDLDITVWNGEVVDQDFYARDFVKNTILEVNPELKY